MRKFLWPGLWLLTALLMIIGGIAIGTVRHAREPECSASQAAEVRSIVRECVVHTHDGVDWCAGKAREFVGCTP